MARYAYHKKRKNPLIPVLIALLALVAVAAIVLLLVWNPTGGSETAVPGDATTTTTTTTTTTAAPSVAGQYVVTDKLNVRLGPGMEFDILKVLQPGEVIEVLREENGWYCIPYNGEYAYVSAEYVVPSTADATSTTASSETTTTTTTSSTKKTGTTTQQYTDRYIDEDGMLQFKPGNNYVQAESYADGNIPWNLLLVNDWNPMQEGYDDAVTMKTVDRRAVNNNQKVDARMYEDLMKMLDAGKAYNIGVQSSYRSYATQKRLYNNKVAYYKGIYSDPVMVQTKAGEVVKRPGFSEHNTGLAVDLYGSGDYSLTESFAKTKAYAWLIENCADYGFILRFPKGKESVTGVIYEAWHFRYVGDTKIAHEIMDNGLCLEEYLAQTKQ